MKKFLAGVFTGIFIGWATVTLAQASDNDAKTYKDLLRKVIYIVEQIQKTSQQTAENTLAIRKKLNAD